MALGIRLRDLLLLNVPPGAALDRAATTWMLAAGPLLLGAALAGAGAVLLQTGFLLHAAALLPDLSRLDPRKGLKRVLGPANAMEAARALAKLAVLAWVLWGMVHGLLPVLATAVHWVPGEVFSWLGRQVTHIVLVALAWQAGLSLLDIAWVRWRFGQRMRMSREDLKQEHREAEGDPKVKQRLRQLRIARSRRRMLQAVAKATVVVTNPTHYAVALSYRRGGQGAPRIVAKGMDEVAGRIRNAAAKAGVPVVPSPPLARALHELPLDSEVPAEHFKVVAEVIAYVWRLRGQMTSKPAAG